MRVMGGERECRIKEFDSETACFKRILCEYIRWDFHARERSFFILTLVDSETKTIAQIVLRISLLLIPTFSMGYSRGVGGIYLYMVTGKARALDKRSGLRV